MPMTIEQKNIHEAAERIILLNLSIGSILALTSISINAKVHANTKKMIADFFKNISNEEINNDLKRESIV